MKTNIIPIGSRKKVASEEILYLQSDLNYTKVFLVDGQIIFSSTTLKIIESRLSENREFLRINRGIVINRNYIISKFENGLELANNLILNVSRRRKHFLNTI